MSEQTIILKKMYEAHKRTSILIASLEKRITELEESVYKLQMLAVAEKENNKNE